MRLLHFSHNRRVSFARVTFFTYVFGVLFLAFCTVGYVDHADVWLLDSNSTIAVFYAAFASASVFLCLSWSMKYLAPVVVTAFYPVQVLASGVISHFCFGDAFGRADILGAVLILVGLMTVCICQALLVKKPALLPHTPFAVEILTPPRESQKLLQNSIVSYETTASFANDLNEATNSTI